MTLSKEELELLLDMLVCSDDWECSDCPFAGYHVEVDKSGCPLQTLRNKMWKATRQ